MVFVEAILHVLDLNDHNKLFQLSNTVSCFLMVEKLKKLYR